MKKNHNESDNESNSDGEELNSDLGSDSGSAASDSDSDSIGGRMTSKKVRIQRQLEQTKKNLAKRQEYKQWKNPKSKK